MNTNTRIKDVRIVEHGLILLNRKNEKREISFSELDKIYIKVIKLNPIFELGLILAAFTLFFFVIQYITFEKIVFLSLSSVVPFFVKATYYKSYGLRICLKDGSVFRKKVPLSLKDKNILFVSEVRRAQLNYYNCIHKV
ncbi:MAG: hypothetical protein RIR01_1096 [Bacteroidota bacterium]|jgi:hypothetical protein